MRIIKQILGNRYAQLCINLIIALAMLMLARIIFIAYNYTNYYEGFLTWKLIGNIFQGGLRFDLSTLFYINGLYIVLYLLPIGIKEGRGWNKFLKWEFVVTNAIAMLSNLIDCKYVQFTGRRSTATIFSEFEHENNLAKIAGTEILNNIVWIILFIALILLVWKVYRTPQPVEKAKRGWGYYLGNTAMLCLCALVAVGAIRGGVDRTTRPITLSDANKYVDRPIEAAAVLNTPFSIIRSMGKTSYNLPPYMSEEEATTLFSPLHLPTDSTIFMPKNVVILIVESFSRGFIGALNQELNDSTYKGYTPFADELAKKSYTFKHSFANGMKSIDGMPSVLSSIPMMIEPFFLTPASMNDMGGIAYYLKDKGYASAFFHGAPNGSMGFEAFARKSGFDKYYGLSEYNNKYPGNDDFDGSWAIWDEPFLQYFAEEMGNLPEPFVASVFTASSHHPFALPKEYIDTFPEEGNHPI
ncbi:MAG: LTA synthase family protein, partial [Muribaculaceae bacterium]|nr:LTA synthase family protein [Muribaculaceae bacterium]